MANSNPQENARFYDAKPWLAHYAAGVKGGYPELPFSNISEMVTMAATRYKDRAAFTLCLPNGMNATLTFRQVEELSTQFAAFLTGELGLVKGDRVAVQMPNTLAYPVAAFGILRAGLVLVNVNPLYTEAEMEHQFNDSGAKALVIIDLFGDKLTNVIPRTQVRHIITVSVADFFPQPLRTVIKLKMKLGKQIPSLKVHALPFMAALSAGKSRSQGSHPWAKSTWSETAPAEAAAAHDGNARTGALGTGEAAPDAASKGNALRHGWVALDDLAVLQYTGGTTGVAKGAMLSHGNLLSNVVQIATFGAQRIVPGQETILTVLPLYHIFAFTANLLTFFHLGASNVLIPNPRPITNLKKAFEKFEITWMTGVNTLFNALGNEAWFAEAPPRSLKMSIAGGAALQAAVAERWQKVTKTPVLEGYGLTETSPVLCFNPLGGKVKSECIGVPLPNTDIRLVDDNGECVPPGEPGELIARGAQVMLGYWKKPDETAKTIKDGWLYTGDVATCDAEGYFKIVDRKKEMILVSGFNVYPNEVEDCIAKMADVAEVAVIGVPDDNRGEMVKAYVVPRSPGLTSDEVREHCRKHLTGYKVPRVVEFRKDLPKTPVGKILRKDLRAELKIEKR